MCKTCFLLLYNLTLLHFFTHEQVCFYNLKHSRDFPGGPVVKTPHFHCRGSRFDPCSGKLRSCMLHKSESESLSVVSDSLQPHGLNSPRNSPGQNTGVGSHSLLQEVFLTQGLHLGVLHCRQIFTVCVTRKAPLR